MTDSLTEEELGRIAAEHVPDVPDCLDVAFCRSCDVRWPCTVSRLYDLVECQSVLLVEWGLPCSCDPDFDLPGGGS